MNVLIIGAGAMGCRFGVALHKAGADVCLYDVAAAHVNQMKNHGLTVENGDISETYFIKATTDIADVPSPDAAFIFTKAIHSRSALQTVSGAFTKNTAIVTMQNGLGNIETIADFVDKEQIIAGITSYACDLIGPGCIRYTGDGETYIMALSERNASVAQNLADLLTKGGICTRISNDVLINIWEKVAFNAAINTLTAISGLPIKYISLNTFSSELCYHLAEEVTEVAKADGVNADLDRVKQRIAFALSEHGEHKPSMLQDREHHRRSEIDAIVGSVIQKANAHGIPVPSLKSVYALVKMIEGSYLMNS